MSRGSVPTKSPRERVLVCGIRLPDDPQDLSDDIAEVRALIKAAEAEPVGETMLQNRRKPHPATLLGKGKVEEVAEAIKEYEPDAVVVDNDLTPAQGRNLEKAWDTRVIDRSELILDIFASRAQTRQASLQVELAQTEYLFPRLRRMWTHLERTEGAIGTRGPGETQLETDQRLLRKRIHDLKTTLGEIERRKQRQVGSRSEQFTIGLVGYTNAGKSTLLNLLTGANEFVADMPFATLDTRTRQWRLPDNRTVLLSDTVGFLQRLPHHLVASFHATLEETIQADLLLHVVDASHSAARQQIEAVDEVLGSLRAGMKPDVLVLNKVDRVPDPIALHLLLEGFDGDIVYLSAKTGEGSERLAKVIMQRMDERTSLVQVSIPAADGRTMALLRRFGALLNEEVAEDGSMVVRSRLTDGAVGVLRRECGQGVNIEILETPQEPLYAPDDSPAVALDAPSDPVGEPDAPSGDPSAQDPDPA